MATNLKEMMDAAKCGSAADHPGGGAGHDCARQYPYCRRARRSGSSYIAKRECHVRLY